MAAPLQRVSPGIICPMAASATRKAAPASLGRMKHQALSFWKCSNAACSVEIPEGHVLRVIDRRASQTSCR